MIMGDWTPEPSTCRLILGAMIAQAHVDSASGRLVTLRHRLSQIAENRSAAFRRKRRHCIISEIRACESALEWLADDSLAPGSFGWCCSLLDLNPADARKLQFLEFPRERGRAVS